MGYPCPIFCQGNAPDFSLCSVFRNVQVQEIRKEPQALENASAYHTVAHILLVLCGYVRLFVCLSFFLGV